MGLIVVFAISCLALGAADVVFMLRLSRLRRAGIYPQPGQASAQDISRLVQLGYTGEAMRCHREVHGSSLRQAKAAVDAMRAAS